MSSAPDLKPNELYAPRVVPPPLSENRAGGRRQKAYRLPVVHALNSRESSVYPNLVTALGRLLVDPTPETPREPGMDSVLDRQTVVALRASRFQRVDPRFRAFKRAGLDRFLLRVMREGTLTRRSVDAEIERWKGLVENDPARAEDIKEGFRVFDALAQRIALAGGSLEYAAKNNGPRDLLSTFAGAFHR